MNGDIKNNKVQVVMGIEDLATMPENLLNIMIEII